MIIFRSSGVLVISIVQMIPLTHTDLPEPVVPAISRCGIEVRSAVIGWPETSCPSASLSVWHFDADVALARHGSLDADGRRGQRQRQIVGQCANLADLHFDPLAR